MAGVSTRKDDEETSDIRDGKRKSTGSDDRRLLSCCVSIGRDMAGHARRSLPKGVLVLALRNSCPYAGRLKRSVYLLTRRTVSALRSPGCSRGLSIHRATIAVPFFLTRRTVSALRSPGCSRGLSIHRATIAVRFFSNPAYGLRTAVAWLQPRVIHGNEEVRKRQVTN